MRFVDFVSPVFLKTFLFFGIVFTLNTGHAQSNVAVRVMAANLNGNTQSYQPFAIRIFQGLKPDVIAIQEFDYSSTNGVDVNDSLAMREMVDTAFGTNFAYFREPLNGGGDIPNGVISRYPIIASGSWTDALVANRGFAWAQIDLPGSNDLYVVSVHLLTDTAAHRATESANLKTLMQANFPANAWIVVAGDFNADPRTEVCITTFNGYLADFPIPVDNLGNSDTSVNRNHPHDYVLPSLTLTNFETATVLPSHSFPSGLVFDSNVYTPLSDVAPVLAGDSGQAQHMAVMKDFLIPVTITVTTNPPAITAQPQGQIISPGSNVTFTVAASGASPLAYQWLFNTTNILNATNNAYTLVNVQFTNAGNYSVSVTNIAGSVTSSNAVLTVSNFPPAISTQPQSQTVSIGSNPVFTVAATGTAPLNYQWCLGGTNISGANTNSYTRSNVQTNDAGNYSVIITNVAGSVTSSVATLTVLVTNSVVIAQWNFNSVSADTNVNSGTTSPSIGTGTASAIGGVSPSFISGSSNDPAASGSDNSAWTTTGYPSANANNKTAGVQFNVSTAGKQNISISWDQRVSNTGSKYVRLQYTTNGTSFTDFRTATTGGTTFASSTNSLAAIAGVNNNSSFAIRIVAEFESTAAGTANTNYVGANGTYATTGTIRFDLVTVAGTAIINNSPPAAAAVLSAPSFSAGQFQMLVTGSAGSNYVVQVSTNLASANWLPLSTNASPFTFTDANVNAAQNFYRAVSSP